MRLLIRPSPRGRVGESSRVRVGDCRDGSRGPRAGQSAQQSGEEFQSASSRQPSRHPLTSHLTHPAALPLILTPLRWPQHNPSPNPVPLEPDRVRGGPAPGGGSDIRRRGPRLTTTPETDPKECRRSAVAVRVGHRTVAAQDPKTDWPGQIPKALRVRRQRTHSFCAPPRDPLRGARTPTSLSDRSAVDAVRPPMRTGEQGRWPYTLEFTSSSRS